jgi:hypothetical protein
MDERTARCRRTCLCRIPVPSLRHPFQREQGEFKEHQHVEEARLSPYYQGAPNRDRVLRNSGPSHAHVVRSHEGAVRERGPQPRSQLLDGDPGRLSGERGASQRRQPRPRGEPARARVSPSWATIRNRSITQRQLDLYRALVDGYQRGKDNGLFPPKGAAPALRPSPRFRLNLAYRRSRPRHLLALDPRGRTQGPCAGTERPA